MHSEDLLSVGMKQPISESDSNHNLIYELLKKVNGKVNHVGRKIVEHANKDDSTSDRNVITESIHQSKETSPLSTDASCQADSIPPPVKHTVSSSNKSQYLQQPSVLYVTDSVGCATSMRLVEKLSKTRVRTKRSSGSGKKLQDVVLSNLDSPGRDPYEILVIAAPTDDISNLKVEENTKAAIEDQVKHSCNNVLKTAKEALSKHSNLKKVILSEHPPRFDSRTKSDMALLANHTLHELVEEVKSEFDIEIGVHNLDCFGIGRTHEARYVNSILKKEDGIHFVGPRGLKDYSESLINIITTSLKNSGMGVQPDYSLMGPALPLKNRFESLNQGNC